MTIAMEEVKEHKISAKLHENVTYINDLVGIGTSWDILAKEFRFGNLNMMSYVTNGYFMTINVVVLLENLQASIREFVLQKDGQSFEMEELIDYLSTNVSFVQVQPVPKMGDAVRFILSGPLVTFIDGYDQAFLIDTRIYPMRSIEEPEVERVIRGPRDGFTETMLMNTAMIRRRLRDPNLRVELMQIGARSQTDVSLLYLKDVTNDDLLKDIKKRLKEIQVDSITMGEQAVIELIGRVKWNPYPIARYTERPDVAATALVEGHVVIVVDNSPEVIIAPTSFFQHLQHPQEYHSYPMVGTYIRWAILLAVFASIYLPGVFVVFNAHPHLTPKELAFFKADKSDPLPIWAELIIAEFALHVLRLAVINTPNALASSVGIIAALLFGQFAAKIQLLQPEVLVYMGFVMIAELATSSYELATANQMARIWIVICSATLHLTGFCIGAVGLFILLLRTKSFGVPYLWPLIPFQWKNGLRDVLFRLPTSNITGRPPILNPKTLRRKGS